MIKKTIIILFLALLSCSNQKADLSLSHAAFYSSPEKIIRTYKNSKDYRAQYAVAMAYKKKRNLKKAIYHYSNSAFKSKRIKRLKHYPSPVFRFIKGFHVKSDLYEDAVYHLASIYSSYNEHSYVIKFINLISKDNSSLYLRASLLKAKSLSSKKRNREAIEFLNDTKEDFKSYDAISRINIRLASLHKKDKDYSTAKELYLQTLLLKKKTWQAGLCARNIIRMDIEQKIKITNYTPLAIALYNGKKYKEALYYFNKTLSTKSIDAQKHYIKTLVRLKKFNKASTLINKIKKTNITHVTLLKVMADELWKIRKRHRAIGMYKKIISYGYEPHKKDSLRRVALFFEDRRRGNYKNHLKNYINSYSSDKYTPYLMWLLGRNELRDKNIKSAIFNFKKCITLFPKSTYSARCRFWLHKLSYNKHFKEKMLKDLAMYNPDSFYTWRLFSNITKKKNIITLQKKFDNAINANDKGATLLYNTLLLIKEKNFSNRDNRIKKMPSSFVKKYQDYDNDIYNLKISRFKNNLSKLDKYFQTGDLKAIKAEIRFLDYKKEELDKKRSIYMALAYYGSRYKYYFYSTYFYIQLFKADKNSVDISLMSKKTLYNIFPQPFKKCMTTETKRYKVRQNRLYAMMKTESLFHHKAVSSAKATGLMQLMPGTARGIARKLRLKKYNLKNPCTSIKFGAHYMGWLSRFFKKNNLYMTAGYNAGPGNVLKWKKTLNTKDRDYFTEFIPFIETRFYVYKIEKYMNQYDIIYP